MNKKLTLLSTAMLSATSLLAVDKKPNIILILADDMRGTAMNFLGVEDVHTPNLDKLAAESTVFSNAHIMGGTSGAVSMPSRAMLMTGKYLYTLEKQGSTVPEDHILIGEALQQAGFDWAGLILISFILPAILCPLINQLCRKAGWVKDGDLKLS